MRRSTPWSEAWAAISAKSAALPSIPKELIDQSVTGAMSGEAINVKILSGICGADAQSGKGPIIADRTAPTPPGMRVRSGRFEKLRSRETG